MTRGRISVGIGIGLVAVVAAGLSCLAKIAGSDDVADGGGVADGGAAAGDSSPIVIDAPYQITCRFFSRAITPQRDETLEIVYFTDKPKVADIESSIERIPIRTRLETSTDDPSAIVLSLDFPRSGFTRTFRLPRTRRPRFEFLAGGLSGLNYVRVPGSNVDLQFVCEARPSTFRDASAPSEPPNPSNAVVSHIRCQVTSGTGDEIVVIPEGTKQFARTVRNLTIRFENDDNPFGSHGLALDIEGSMDLRFQVRQFQPLSDPGVGPAGLTGTTIVGAPAADGVSFGCTSVF